MKRFSERIGAKPTPRQIQLDGMDEALRNSLWNEIMSRLERSSRPHWTRATRFLARDLFRIPVDTVPLINEHDAYQWVRARFFGAVWHEAYDIIEFLVRNISSIGGDVPERFARSVNAVLERELSGYRFINGMLVPISDPVEIAAIEQASQSAADAGIAGAHVHIARALGLLGEKPNPDYRNSIKESISAVESVVNLVTGAAGNGVADAIKRLSEHTEIHGALRDGLKKLYGFTSDSDGIRHAIMDQPNVGFDEAKFMLVTCAAFVNFLVGKATTVGLLGRESQR